MNRVQKAKDFYYHTMKVVANPKRGIDFHSGIPFDVSKGKTVLGLRVCSIKLDCGFDNKRLLGLLDEATLPHLVPWECAIEPISYQHGRFVVIEAPWPEGYQRDNITLDTISTPDLRRSDRVVVGLNAAGTNITLPVHDLCHLLVAGQTGSGKSYSLRSIGWQLGTVLKNNQCDNLVVLLDAKGGEGLGVLNSVSPYQIGPLAIKPDDIINALGWCIDEMNRRYAIIEASGGRKLGKQFKHVFVLFDEFQRLTKKGYNPVVTVMLNILATQGRAAKIHVIACTQKPLQESWGDNTTRDQFDAVLGHKVKDRYASEAAMGGAFPKCHKLLPKGDAYVLTHSPYVLDRVQVAYVPEEQILAQQGCQPMNDYWPEFDLAGFTGKPNGGRPRTPPTTEQVAVGIEATVLEKKRTWFCNQLTGDVPGSSRADRILDECAEIVSVMTRRGVRVNKEK